MQRFKSAPRIGAPFGSEPWGPDRLWTALEAGRQLHATLLLLTRMRSLVSSEIVGAVKCFSTLITFVWPFASMSVDMLLQAKRMPECLLASVALPLPQRHIRANTFNVTGKIHQRCENTITFSAFVAICKVKITTIFIEVSSSGRLWLPPKPPPPKKNFRGMGIAQGFRSRRAKFEFSQDFRKKCSLVAANRMLDCKI